MFVALLSNEEGRLAILKSGLQVAICVAMLSSPSLLSPQERQTGVLSCAVVEASKISSEQKIQEGQDLGAMLFAGEAIEIHYNWISAFGDDGLVFSILPVRRAGPSDEEYYSAFIFKSPKFLLENMAELGSMVENGGSLTIGRDISDRRFIGVNVGGRYLNLRESADRTWEGVGSFAIGASIKIFQLKCSDLINTFDEEMEEMKRFANSR